MFIKCFFFSDRWCPKDKRENNHNILKLGGKKKETKKSGRKTDAESE